MRVFAHRFSFRGFPFVHSNGSDPLGITEMRRAARRRKIVLSQVNSVGVGGKTDINAIIDDQRRSGVVPVPQVTRRSSRAQLRKRSRLLRLRLVA